MWQIYYLRTVWFLRSFRHYLFLFIVISILFMVYMIVSTANSENKDSNCIHFIESPKPKPYVPAVRFYGIEENDHSLDILKRTLEKMGYQIEFTSLTDTSWNVLWSHTYPFHTLKKQLSSLKDSQKINHFPGSGVVTQKKNLAQLSLPSIPKSFILPNNKAEFLKYTEKSSELWLLKSINHRGIWILNGTENLDTSDYYVQEFIKDPLLVNKKKFDIGVYVMQTSVDPLRVYAYSGDILLRFCEKDYYPLNINNVDSYIVGDDYIPVWEIPDLQFYYSGLNYTAKESLNAFLKSKGQNPKKLWSNINKVIHDVYFMAEDNMKRSAMALGNLRNFFELVRFDFIADKNLNVFLLEINMSPNLSAAHFSQNSLLYEQVIFSSLSLVGLVRKFKNNFIYSGEAEVSEKDIQINAEHCASSLCDNTCINSKCQVCNHCLNAELKSIARSAYLEHMNKGKYQRIVPAAIVKADLSNTHAITLSEMNSFMDKWYKGKCLQDITWCH